MSWLLVLVRLTGGASRHRVAVWRELRKAGGVPLAPGAWLVPDSAVFASAVERAAELAQRGDGDVIVLDVAARDQASGDRLREAFAEVRLQEWAEFEADCEKFEAEIAKEIRIEKYTLAELEEEEQSLDRLRRWYRDLKARDVLELPEAAAAEQRLKACTELLDDYADRVYRVLHGRPARKSGEGSNE